MNIIIIIIISNLVTATPHNRCMFDFLKNHTGVNVMGHQVKPPLLKLLFIIKELHVGVLIQVPDPLFPIQPPENACEKAVRLNKVF